MVTTKAAVTQQNAAKSSLLARLVEPQATQKVQWELRLPKCSDMPVITFLRPPDSHLEYHRLYAKHLTLRS